MENLRIVLNTLCFPANEPNKSFPENNTYGSSSATDHKVSFQNDLPGTAQRKPRLSRFAVCLGKIAEASRLESSWSLSLRPSDQRRRCRPLGCGRLEKVLGRRVEMVLNDLSSSVDHRTRSNTSEPAEPSQRGIKAERSTGGRRAHARPLLNRRKLWWLLIRVLTNSLNRWPSGSGRDDASLPLSVVLSNRNSRTQTSDFRAQRAGSVRLRLLEASVFMEAKQRKIWTVRFTLDLLGASFYVGGA